MQFYRVLNPAGQATRASSPDGVTFYPETIESEPVAAREPFTSKRFLPPLVPPTIYRIGLNYRKHAEETGAKIPDYPVVFLKSPTTLLAHREPIFLPRWLRSDKVDFEVELAVVIGRTCKNVKRADALDYVLGYTIANDISARDWQNEWGGSQWCRGKGFDSFCPVGPGITPRSAVSDPNRLKISSRLNGQTMQESQTCDMIFSVEAIIEFLSGSTTLAPYTLILTGTPAGVGAGRKPPVYLKPGDEIEIEIEGLGILRNPVVEESLS